MKLVNLSLKPLGQCLEIGKRPAQMRFGFVTTIQVPET